MEQTPETTASASDFIRDIVRSDLSENRVKEVVTRFPPEPNGYLHIGHAKSICINFGIAGDFGGRTNLRFDDTNPLKEDSEYVKAIQEDVAWLGFQWDGLRFASDYFEEMYERALLLIRKGLAYVDDQSADQVRESRGTLTSPGQNSPHRDRSVEENLNLFARMRAGEFADGTHVLRAKIDMTSPNLNLRDPVLYRISHAVHHNTGEKWCIYPMYAYAHPLEDAIEGVTHSLCTLEFKDQRPLYDWVVHECEMPNVPHQYEFGRLNLTDTVMSKRHLKKLVDEGLVDGWDDPRMPTISGFRRRGFTPEAIRSFITELGVTVAGGEVDYKLLEHHARQDLNLRAPRTSAVLRPLKLVITNYPEGQTEMLEATINPERPELGKKQVPFSRELYIEQDDFMEVPPPKYHRLYPGNEVRLKDAYFVTCQEVVKDDQGEVVEVRCTYDPETKSGSGFTARKVKGTIHWVDAATAIAAEIRLYEPLLQGEFDAEAPLEAQINPASLQVCNGYIGVDVKDAAPGDKFQFVRQGFFNVDPKDTTPEHKVFNLIVSLKSSFKVEPQK
ncbi:glutamine--tRNA ligase/YqeY domain fusion protein [Alicyclobacillus sp. ALC3]|uniref:glutamine--tRNA ligase/YqeY domain fusion protein n=1 Tax=Alicyclobacillus sp. ALC3 TaxID=2796143 RepID=UPI00237845FB|nr:glutamine--tRNA ligase/YqeY domain fusion protein [Alicyclobacillus sp. ALC3]WDL98309.1 glutamine--tRNA ligase/YqeY domain fusion protein [Alicyclobacillus sp. ALC3]